MTSEGGNIETRHSSAKTDRCAKANKRNTLAGPGWQNSKNNIATATSNTTTCESMHDNHAHYPQIHSEKIEPRLTHANINKLHQNIDTRTHTCEPKRTHAHMHVNTNSTTFTVMHAHNTKASCAEQYRSEQSNRSISKQVNNAELCKACNADLRLCNRRHNLREPQRNAEYKTHPGIAEMHAQVAAQL